MRFRSGFSHVLCLSVLVSMLAPAGFADTIRLKDGSLIKGHIVSFNAGKFVVEIGEGGHLRQLTFAASEIESIAFDPPTTQSMKGMSVPATYMKPEPKPATPPTVIVNDTSIRKDQPSSPPRPAASGSKTQPIEWTTKVLADNTANGWTNSGWVVKKGQRIRITGDGTVSLGKGKSCSPSGDADLNDDQKLLKSVATGALIAVIGDNNNDFIYIGAEREFTATRDGPLFLGINEGNLNDNSGAFNVKIEIVPDRKSG